MARRGDLFSVGLPIAKCRFLKATPLDQGLLVSSTMKPAKLQALSTETHEPRLDAIDQLHDVRKLLALLDRAICDVPSEIALEPDERDGAYLVFDAVRERLDSVIASLEKGLGK